MSTATFAAEDEDRPKASVSVSVSQTSSPTPLSSSVIKLTPGAGTCNRSTELQRPSSPVGLVGAGGYDKYDDSSVRSGTSMTSGGGPPGGCTLPSSPSTTPFKLGGFNPGGLLVPPSPFASPATSPLAGGCTSRVSFATAKDECSGVGEGSRLVIPALRSAYREGSLTPSQLVDTVLHRIALRGDDKVWLHVNSRSALMIRAAALEKLQARMDQLPLYGVPFAVKDNIDVYGVPTTAACPAFSYQPLSSAVVVQQLEAAGAILIGKTNMDQFATGLVGVRSPYGIPSSVFDSKYISGGSSSGSAVAVAALIVSFALGTDTAGSGRVPAQFNNIIGLKPTKGLISCRGVVPACRSLDTVSVFALSCDDAWTVLRVVDQPDEEDPFSREHDVISSRGERINGPGITINPCGTAGSTTYSAFYRPTANQTLLALGGIHKSSSALSVASVNSFVSSSSSSSSAGAAGVAGAAAGADAQRFRFGVPTKQHLRFYGNVDAEACFDAAVQRLVALGGTKVEIDYAPFSETASLLYGGPWVAERLVAIKEFAGLHADALLPVIRQIIVESGSKHQATDAFVSYYKLKQLKRVCRRVWSDIDVLVTPTAGTHYKIDEVLADPIQLNSNLGYYTNFMNLLDMSAVAVPAGFQASTNLPFGITLSAPALNDAGLCKLGSMFVGDSQTGYIEPPISSTTDFTSSHHQQHSLDFVAEHTQPPNYKLGDGEMELVVAGAHMSGFPLSHQLLDVGGRLLWRTRTAAVYKCYLLNGLDFDPTGKLPNRPGLVRVPKGDHGGGSLGVEVWALPQSAVGSFLISAVKAPLSIGIVQLLNGSSKLGFVCEAGGAVGCEDVTKYGGWRPFIRSLHRAAGAVVTRPVSFATSVTPLFPVPFLITKNYNTILIANRGEIACRVIRACRKLGLRPIAVYSEADAHSMHVRLADKAVCIGPAPAAQSYLDMDRLLTVCAQEGVSAIHPGYGFLSENPTFTEACDKAGVIFVGPAASTMRQFGLKHEARAFAIAQGIPVVPGSGLLDSLHHALAEAERIGFPIILKSAAGGGGIGMKVCDSSVELRGSFESVQRSSLSFFKNGSVYLEKYVTSPRHIEVQIFGDGTGNVVALGERECSIQRRHQKIIEETPSPFVSPTLRNKLCQAAVQLGQAVK